MGVIKTVKTVFSYAFFKLLLGKNKKMNSLKYNMCSISTLYIDRVQRRTFRALHLSKKSDYIKKTRKKKPTSLYKSNSSLAPLSIEKTFIFLYRNMNYDSANSAIFYFVSNSTAELKKKNHYNCLSEHIHIIY